LVHGGQQPIQSAHVYLFAVTVGSYGANSTSLITNATNHDSVGNYVLTNAQGGFSIPAGSYACNSGEQVYLYSLGGNAGFGTNSAAGLLAVLGQCGTGNSFTGLPATIQMNELTTVAAAYALAGYATSATQMSGNKNNPAFQSGISGLANAAKSAANLVGIGGGGAYATTPAGNGTVPQTEINTLADILAACINTAAPSSGGCTTLFNNAKSGGSTGTAATDTATAAINIAHNPGANVANLFALATPTSPFQPTLTPAPADWTLAVNYTDASLNGVTFIAIDATGNVWVTNNDGNSITEFSPNGGLLHTTALGGLNGPNGVAVDANGCVWVANGGQGNGNSISEFDANANVNPASPFIGGGVDDPWGIAIDSSGSVWVANFDGNSISQYNPGASCTTAGSYGNGNAAFTDPNGSLDSPLFIAADPYGNLWVTNTAGGGSPGSSLDEYVPGTGFTSFTDASIYDPVGVAIDNTNTIWIANELNNAVTSVNYFNSDQINVYTGGGLSISDGIAIDGASNIWISNYGVSTGNPTGGNTVSEFNNGVAVSGANGYQYRSGNLSQPQGIATDSAGNVWIGDNGSNTITELVGAATPVITPLAAALQNYLLATAP
jgi:streptogramin lyase